MDLEILYNDAHLVVVNKPNNLAIHRSKLVRNTNDFAVDLIREQTGRLLNPVHRLDRKTSGILVFSDTPEAANAMRIQFEERSILKTYLAIVRGYLRGSGIVDKRLINDKGVEQSAETHFQSLATTEIPVSLGKHSTSRYSLVELKPKTGRQHQIRKHLNHLRHPIVGDRPHGCNKQNRLFKQTWNITNMMLHAQQIKFEHPISKEMISLHCAPPPSFMTCLNVLEFDTVKL